MKNVYPILFSFVCCSATIFSAHSLAQDSSTVLDEGVDPGVTVEIPKTLSSSEMEKLMDSLPAPPETKFSEMIRLCNNLGPDNKVIEPNESKKECRKRYRELRQDYRRANRRICRNANKYSDPDVRAIALQSCDKFGPDI